jgi:hypothetical protein
LVWCFRTLFSQPQPRLDYGQDVPEIVSDATGHFTERRNPLGSPRALLCRRLMG